MKIIGEEIKADVFKIWFEPIVAVNLTGGVLTVQVPSSFFYEWLEENYVNLAGQGYSSGYWEKVAGWNTRCPWLRPIKNMAEPL